LKICIFKLIFIFLKYAYSKSFKFKKKYEKNQSLKMFKSKKLFQISNIQILEKNRYEKCSYLKISQTRKNNREEMERKTRKRKKPGPSQHFPPRWAEVRLCRPDRRTTPPVRGKTYLSPVEM
jgi:hypothetical protein